MSNNQVHGTIDGFRVPFQGLFIHCDAVPVIRNVISISVPNATNMKFLLDNENYEKILIQWFDANDALLEEYMAEFDGTKMVFDDALEALTTLLHLPYSF